MNVDDICGIYELSHYGGKIAPASATLSISRDGDSLRVAAKVANYLRGPVTLENNRLSGMLMSTMMMGTEGQMKIEEALSSGFGAGLAIRMENGRLLLKNADSSLIFDRILNVDDIVGEHVILTIDDAPVDTEMTVKLSADGNGGLFIVANIANSIRGNCAIDSGSLHGDVVSTHMDAAPQYTAIEEKLIHGLRTGLALSRNDSGLLLRSRDLAIQLLQVVSREEIRGEYALKAFNGAAVDIPNAATVAFDPEEDGEGIAVYIAVANRLRGMASLDQNLLRIDEPLMSTKMLGTDEETRLEAAFNASLQYGVEVALLGRTLYLRSEDSTFELLRLSEVEYSGEESPTYHGTYTSKCFKTEGNGLLFRIVNEVENRWAFYNDSDAHRMHIRAVFGTRSKIAPLDNARLEQDEDGRNVVQATVEPRATEMFISGKVNGFRISYTAEPISQQPPAPEPDAYPEEEKPADLQISKPEAAPEHAEAPEEDVPVHGAAAPGAGAAVHEVPAEDDVAPPYESVPPGEDEAAAPGVDAPQYEETHEKADADQYTEL